MSQPEETSSNCSHEGNEQKSKEILLLTIQNMVKFLYKSQIDIENASISELGLIKDEIEKRFAAIELTHSKSSWKLNDYLDSLIQKEFSDLLEQYYKDLRTVVTRMDALGKEPFQIPTFNGDIKEWTSFYYLFKKHIHENKNFSNVEKMSRLKNLMKGEAIKLIRTLKVNSSNYEIAIFMLRERYENRQLIYNAWVDKLVDQPQVKIKSASSVQKFLNTTNECISAFKKLNVHRDNFEPFIARIIIRKFDTDGIKKYELVYGTSQEIQSLRNVLAFLEMHSNGLKEESWSIFWPIILGIVIYLLYLLGS